MEYKHILPTEEKRSQNNYFTKMFEKVVEYNSIKIIAFQGMNRNNDLYTVVPGIIEKLYAKNSHDGGLVSEVKVIKSKEDKKSITAILHDNEFKGPVTFW